MAIYNRIYCLNCRASYNISRKSDRKKTVICNRCFLQIDVSKQKNYYIEYYVNKKRVREKTGSSRQLAENVLYKRKFEVAEGRLLNRKKLIRIKFEDFSQQYLELYSKINNKSWGSADQPNVNTLNKYFEGMYLHEITIQNVEEFKISRSKEVSPATVNRQLTCLKSIFNRAKDWNKFEGENPVNKVKLFQEKNNRLRYLEENEINCLISNCNERIEPIVILAINTGMRRGEILGLKWEHIDFQQELIYLTNTKNGDNREIPMNSLVKKTLKYLTNHSNGEFVFTSKDGKKFGDFRKSFFTALTKSGIKDFRFHDLRHTFASQLAMNGVNLNTIRELLGHKSLTMTLRYSHLSTNHKKQAVEVLSKKIVTESTPKVIEDNIVTDVNALTV